MKPPCARSAPASQVRRRRASGQEGGEAGRVQARWHTSRERQQAGRADGQDACVGGGHGPVRRTGLGVGGGRQGGRRDKSRARRWASPRRPRSGEERRRAAGAPAGRGCSQTRQSSPCSCPGCCPSRASTRRGSPAASRLAGPPGFAAARPPGPLSMGGALQQPRSILTMHPLLQLAGPVVGRSCAQVPSEDVARAARLTAQEARARAWCTRAYMGHTKSVAAVREPPPS